MHIFELRTRLARCKGGSQSVAVLGGTLGRVRFLALFLAGIEIFAAGAGDLTGGRREGTTRIETTVVQANEIGSTRDPNPEDQDANRGSGGDPVSNSKDAVEKPSRAAVPALTGPRATNAPRRAYVKLFNALQGEPSQLRVLVFGDSMAWGKPRFIIGNLAGLIGHAGQSTNVPSSVSGRARTANGSTVPYDFDVFPTGEYAETNGDGAITWGATAPMLMDTFKIFYKRGPNAGKFKVQVAKDQGDFVDDPGLELVDADSRAVSVGVITLSKPPGRYRVRVLGVDGNVRFPPPLWRNTSIGGVEVYRMDRGGLSLSAMLANPKVLAAIVGEIAPDLIFFEMKESEALMSTYLPVLTSTVSAVSPNSRWVFIASSPVAPPNDGEQVAQNRILMAHAETIGAYVFDAYRFAGGSYEMMVADAFIADGTHSSAAFDSLVATQISTELGLTVSTPIINHTNGLPSSSGVTGAAPRATLKGGVTSPQIWFDTQGVDDPAIRFFKGTGTGSQYREGQVRVDGEGRIVIYTAGMLGHVTETTVRQALTVANSAGGGKIIFYPALGKQNGAINFLGSWNSPLDGFAWESGETLYKDSRSFLTFTGRGLKLGGGAERGSSVEIFPFNGPPEGQVAAPVGSLVVRTDAPVDGGVPLYVKVAGADANGWCPVLVAVPVPANASASGREHQVAFDSSYLYICVAPNTWRRVPLSSW